MTPEHWNRLSGWHNAWLAADAGERERLRTGLAVEHADLLSEADGLAAASANLPGFLETPAFVLAAPELANAGPLLGANTMVGPSRSRARPRSWISGSRRSRTTRPRVMGVRR